MNIYILELLTRAKCNIAHSCDTAVADFKYKTGMQQLDEAIIKITKYLDSSNSLKKSLPEMEILNPKEKSRTYYFNGQEKVVLANVTEFLARPSGTHRLKTEDGKLHIIPAGWIHIEIEAEEWTL